MNEDNSITREIDLVEENETYYFQVDFLKAAMIFLVIFDHIVSWGIKNDIGVALWERISIPVFLVIMGFNMGISFRRKGFLELKELYSWKYFKSKILRYVLPFLILYTVSTLIGLFIYGFDLSAMYHGQYYPRWGFMNLFIGLLPFWGPGNWFIPVILQSILVLPILYRAFTKKPILTFISCFVIEIITQLIVFFFIGDITSWQELHILNMFMTSILFYLSAVGLGMWFSFGYDLKSNRNFFMWVLFPISLAYLIAYQFFDFRFMIDDVPLLRGDYHFFVFPYSAFLFLLAMRFIPQKSDIRISKAISLIGKSTYHILLIQILGFGMIYALFGTHYSIDVGFKLDDILDLIFAWIVFISFGILWFKIEQNKFVLRRLFYYINLFIVFVSLLLFIFLIQEDWVPLSLIFILVYAIIALISSFCLKKPLSTRVLGLWTLFLSVTFVSSIIHIEILQPNDFWITLIPIGIFLIVATIGSIFDYISKK